MADPTAMPTIAPVLRPVVTCASEVEVELGAETEVVLEVEVAIEVELVELSPVVDNCVDAVLVERVELLEEEVVTPGCMMNPGEGIFSGPPKPLSKFVPRLENRRAYSDVEERLFASILMAQLYDPGPAKLTFSVHRAC